MAEKPIYLLPTFAERYKARTKAETKTERAEEKADAKAVRSEDVEDKAVAPERAAKKSTSRRKS